MSEVEILWFIFVDTFTTNLFFMPGSELAIWVSLKISEVNYYKILVVGFFGVLCGSIVNFVMGTMISKIFQNQFENNVVIQRNSKTLKDIFARYYLLLLAMSFIPVYSKFLILAAGYARFNFVLMVLVTSIFKTIYYGY